MSASGFKTGLAGLGGAAAVAIGAASFTFAAAYSALWLVGGLLALAGALALALYGGWRFWTANEWMAGRVAATTAAWALATLSIAAFLAMIVSFESESVLDFIAPLITGLRRWGLPQAVAALFAVGFIAAFTGWRNSWAGYGAWGGAAFACANFGIAAEEGAYPALADLADAAGDGLWVIFAIPMGMGAGMFYIARWRGRWRAKRVGAACRAAARFADAKTDAERRATLKAPVRLFRMNRGDAR